MKKIIVAIDALIYNENAVEYAIGIAKRSGGMIAGIFLHDLAFLNYSLPGTFDFVPAEYEGIIKRQKEDDEKLQLNMKLFNHKCNEENVRHKAHVYDGNSIVDFLIEESVYADLLILDEHMSFTYVRSHQISTFVLDVLEDAHCPVLVVPDKYHTIDNIYLCYDGKPSSVFAIKQFSYLFPEWSQKPTTLVSFNETSSNHLKNSSNIKDLLHQHFSNLSIDVEHHTRIGEALFSYFKLYEENSFIVMGAFGRSSLSRLLKKSLANTLIKEVKVPIFITHE